MSDRHVVRARIDALVEGRGRSTWATPPRGPWSALLMPLGTTRGTPILVNVSDDEIVLTIGLGSKVFLASSDPDEIDQSLAILEAILDHGATEYGVLADGEILRTDVVVEGAFGSLDFPRDGAVLVGVLKPWGQRQQ